MVWKVVVHVLYSQIKLSKQSASVIKVRAEEGKTLVLGMGQSIIDYFCEVLKMEVYELKNKRVTLKICIILKWKSFEIENILKRESF